MSQHNSQRVALVTGAAGGIGSEICRVLDEAGVIVAACDVNITGAQSVIAALPAGSSKAFGIDLTDRQSIEAAHANVLSEYGQIEILVNCAGWDKVEPFVKSTWDTWMRLNMINLLAPILLTQLCLPKMMESQWGRMIHIGSDAARVGSTGEAVYSACKAGIVGFSRTIAREGAKFGITSNSVCPGPTDTPLLGEVISENPKLVESLKRSIPLGRLGQPRDVANLVGFLASDKSEYITGQTISVSGGLTML